MVFAKQILAAAAVASVAFAQSDNCSPSETFTVQNQGDASTVGQCKTFKGDISINTNAGATLDFGSVKSITGKVSMENDGLLSSLKFSSLTNLGSLSLNNLTSLAALDFGSLQTVGDMDLINLAALNSFNFGSGLQSAGSISIQNVQISELSGISSAQVIDDVSISNCKYLTSVMFNVGDIGSVDIGPNNVAQGLSISFPKLSTATGLILRNATSISTPSLTSVSDTLSLIGNKVTSYGAANLTYVGALVIQSNAELKNLSFPKLASINGSDSTMDIENNTALTSISGFPVLSQVSGGATFAGNIENVSLPEINTINGALTVLSTSPNLDCTTVNGYSGQVVHGATTCTPGDSGAIGTTNGTSSSSGGGSSSSSSAAMSMELPTFLTTGAFAALLAFLA